MVLRMKLRYALLRYVGGYFFMTATVAPTSSMVDGLYVPQVGGRRGELLQVGEGRGELPQGDERRQGRGQVNSSLTRKRQGSR